MSVASTHPVEPGMMARMKLYVITRQDLSPGAQAVQSCHALMQFSCEHPDLGKTWYEQSNTLSLLAVENELQLQQLLFEAQERGIRTAAFNEPDLKNALTAIALEPSPKTRRLVARLPLTLRPK